MSITRLTSPKGVIHGTTVSTPDGNVSVSVAADGSVMLQREAQDDALVFRAGAFWPLYSAIVQLAIALQKDAGTPYKEAS